MERILRAVIVTLIGLSALLAGPIPVAGEGAARNAEEALALCHRAERIGAPVNVELLARGLRLAEAAVALDNANGRAHLAVFCNLGKQLQLRGMTLWSLGMLLELRQEIDIALQLAPDDPEILAAKGALLVELPRMLGGDARQGEQLLRRSLMLNGGNPGARRYLSRVSAAHGH